MKSSVVAALCALSISHASIAATPLYPQPFQIGEETARFNKGIPLVSLEQEKGGVQITPTAMDHGSMSFMVVVYNDGNELANFGIENVTAEIGGQTLVPFSREQLQSKAKNRAMWSQIGIALLAGAAAGVASTATTKSSYRSYLRTPRGTYSYYGVYRDNSLGVLGAGAATAGGVVAIHSIQQQLDQTLGQLEDEIIQTTTVEPGESYGGRIVLQKIKSSQLPQNVTISITWNGEIYKFGLRVPKKGDPAPAMRPATIASRTVRAAGGVSPALVSAQVPLPPMPGSAAVMPVAAPASMPIPVIGGYKIPAKTRSGYCLAVPQDYRATGSERAPMITDDLPRCAPGA